MKESLNTVTSYSNNAQSADYKVKFFSIKPQEQAIVRFLADSDDDLPVYSYHNITIPSGKTIKVSCNRSIRDDIHKCPFCAANVPLEQQIYVHMLQYYPDKHVEAKVWSRKPPIGNKGTSVIDQIRKALATYGPLSNFISSVGRSGMGLDTSYTLSFNLPNAVYPAESFPLDASDFTDYSEEGSIIKVWTSEEMNTYLKTGQLPTFNRQDTATAEMYSQPAYATSTTTVNNASDSHVSTMANNQQAYQQNNVNDNMTARDLSTVSIGTLNSPYVGAYAETPKSEEIPFDNYDISMEPVFNSQPAFEARPVRRFN